MPEFSPADYANADLYTGLVNKPGQQPLQIPIDFDALNRQAKEARASNPARESPAETAYRLEPVAQREASLKAEAEFKKLQLEESMRKQIEFNERIRRELHPDEPAYQPATEAEIQQRIRQEKLDLEAREKQIFEREQAHREALRKGMSPAELPKPRVTSRTPDWEKNFSNKPTTNPRPATPPPTPTTPTNQKPPTTATKPAPWRCSNNL